MYTHHPGYQVEEIRTELIIILYGCNMKSVVFCIHFRVPQSRFFTTLYPQPIVLSAGTSYMLPVTFRPLEKDIYEDSVEFSTRVGLTYSCLCRITYYQLGLPTCM